MMADLGIAEIRAEGRKMLAKYRNSDGDSTDDAKAIELWFWGWVDELLRDPEGIDEDGIDHICAALIEVGPWDEIDGDGTEASIIADHIRDLDDSTGWCGWCSALDAIEQVNRLVDLRPVVEGDGSGHVLPPFDPNVERMDEL